MDSLFDVAVIGGGINGCGIAADAAQRGLSVILFETDDLAGKTSSSSTKLIHGGLRYLEHYNFALVRKSLRERQRLFKIAPHLVRPLCFMLPYHKDLRSSWVLRAGLFLYDHLSRSNQLPKSRMVKRKTDSLYFYPLISSFDKGFLFYDGATDDARLTLENALQAKAFGAHIVPRTGIVQAAVVNNKWQLVTDKGKAYQARSVINAAGPWAEKIDQLLGISAHHKLSLVSGSHLVVQKLYEGPHAYLLQNEDKRIVFVIPYHGFSLIGTTEVLANKPENPRISTEEIDYLLQITAKYFKKMVKPEDIITSWSGIRPLLAEPKATPRTISRDYVYSFTQTPAPVLSIYGGKLTTYRLLAADAVDELQAIFPSLPASTTEHSLLPGAKTGSMSYAEYSDYAHKQYSWLENSVLERFLKTYGTRAELLLADCRSIHDLGEDFGCGLYQREVEYLVEEEWAETCEDILWRRTKLGLRFSEAQVKKLEEFVQEQRTVRNSRK